MISSISSTYISLQFEYRLGLGLAVELLGIATKVDPNALLVPWDVKDETVACGPINIVDLQNPNTYMQEITQYIYKPRYSNLHPGSTVFKMGARFSVNFPKYKFLHGWNAQEVNTREAGHTFYSLMLAPMQKSSEAHLIGIAVGSSEDQDLEILNQRLEQVTGIRGIEASFQNINQAGITNDFWKTANEKATATMTSKNSREFLRCKYKWAPNAIAIYVPQASMC